MTVSQSSSLMMTSIHCFSWFLSLLIYFAAASLSMTQSSSVNKSPPRVVIQLVYLHVHVHTTMHQHLGLNVFKFNVISLIFSFWFRRKFAQQLYFHLLDIRVHLSFPTSSPSPLSPVISEPHLNKHTTKHHFQGGSVCADHMTIWITTGTHPST